MGPLQHEPSQPNNPKKPNEVSKNNTLGHSLAHQFLEKILGLGAVFFFICLLANIYGYQQRSKMMMEIKSLPAQGFNCTAEQMGQDVLRRSNDEYIASRGLISRMFANPGLTDLGQIANLQYNGLPFNAFIQFLSFTPLNTASWEIRQDKDGYVATCTYQIKGVGSFDSVKGKSKEELELAMAKSMLIRRLPTYSVQLDLRAEKDLEAAFKADSLMHVKNDDWENPQAVYFHLSLLRTKAYFNFLTKHPEYAWSQEYERRLEISLNETQTRAQGFPEWECQVALLLAEIQWKGETPEDAFNTLVDAKPLLFKIKTGTLRSAYFLRLNNNLINYDYRLHPSEAVYKAGIAWITKQLDDLNTQKANDMDDAHWAAIQQARGLLYSTRAELQALLDPREEARIISDIHEAMVYDKTFHFNQELDEFSAYKIIMPILAKDAAFCALFNDKPDELAFIQGKPVLAPGTESGIAGNQKVAKGALQDQNEEGQAQGSDNGSGGGGKDENTTSGRNTRITDQ